METQTQQTNNTAISSIGNTTNVSSNGSEVYTVPGGHGAFHHRQKHPRKRIVEVDKDKEKERQLVLFAGKVTGGNILKAQELQLSLSQSAVYEV
jgi:hypothetical protein